MTPLGKEFRKWRIDQGMLLGEMADALGISTSYLSQIEKGNKPIPPGFVERAIKHFKVDPATADEWLRAEIFSKSEFTVKVANERDREVAHQFVTEFARLTPEQKAEIQRVLGG
jgi:transcriptional regulator with XRE-family HTH domain